MTLRLRTWHVEALVVAAVLVVVNVVGRTPPREWVGAAGVLLTFMHGQVANRLAERDAARETPDVSCSPWSGWYFILREIAWTTYFLWGSAWGPLAGCVLFLAYPAWRRWWRRRHPLVP